MSRVRALYPKLCESSTLRIPQRRHLSSTVPRPALQKNRIYPTSVRREEELHTLVLASASSRVPLLTLWTTNWCAACKTVSPLLRNLLLQDRIGEAQGGVSYVEVEMDAPEMGGVGGLPIRYGITSIPTLLAFDRQEAQMETRVSRLEELKSREFLVWWIETEAARRGSGGAGGSMKKFLGWS